MYFRLNIENVDFIFQNKKFLSNEFFDFVI